MAVVNGMPNSWPNMGSPAGLISGLGTIKARPSYVSVKYQNKVIRKTNKAVLKNAVDKSFMNPASGFGTSRVKIQAIRLNPAISSLAVTTGVLGGSYLVGHAIGKKLAKSARTRHSTRSTAGGSFGPANPARAAMGASASRTNHAVRPGRPRRGGHGAHGRRQQRDSRGRFS